MKRILCSLLVTTLPFGSVISSSSGGDYYFDDVQRVADPTMKEADHAL